MKSLIAATRLYFILTLILGLLYPAFVTLIGQTAFPHQANGSFVLRNGHIIGSELLAQKFEGVKYFWPRPSAIDYNPLSSGGSNLGPTSQALKNTFTERQLKWGAVGAPEGLLSASGSGLDPDIDLQSATYQATRIANARGMPNGKVQSIIAKELARRQLGFLGEERINVLRLNLALDE